MSDQKDRLERSGDGSELLDLNAIRRRYDTHKGMPMRHTVRADIAALVAEVERLRAQPTTALVRGLSPCCWACSPDYPFMLLCSICGNKRCPHANDHMNACTHSNESGQPGSRYAL